MSVTELTRPVSACRQIPLDHPEWAAEMFSTLFEAARVHGTTIQVQAQPAGQGSPSRQAS